MTKYEWDRRLRKSLKELPADERQRVFEYYDELFEDKIDSGEKEEAVVARFGEPEAAARKILADYNAYLGRDEADAANTVAKESEYAAKADFERARPTRGFCEEPDTGGASAKEEVKAHATENNRGESANPQADPFDANTDNSPYKGVTKLKIDVCASEVEIRRADKTNVVVKEDGDSSCSVERSGDTLYIKEKGTSFFKLLGFGVRGKKMLIELPALESLSFDSVKRGCNVSGFGGLRRVTVKTTNGNVRIADCDTEYLSVNSITGDVCVSGGRHDSAYCSTTSGDIRFEGASAVAFTATSMSGDIAADKISVSDKMHLRTVSGGIDADSAVCGNVECKTVSGNNKVVLVGNAADYDIHVRSISGRINAPRGGGDKKKVSISTVSGTIDLDIK